MKPAEAAKFTAPAAAKLLEAMGQTNSPEVRGFLADDFGMLAKQLTPRDLANLLSEHKLSPETTKAILRRLEALAGKWFESIDDAVKWLRSADAKLNAPAPKPLRQP